MTRCMEGTTPRLRGPGYPEHRRKFVWPSLSGPGCQCLKIDRISYEWKYTANEMYRTIDINAGKETRHGLGGSTGHIRDCVKWDGPRNRGASWYHHIGEISGISKSGFRRCVDFWTVLTQFRQLHPLWIYHLERDHPSDWARYRRLRRLSLYLTDKVVIIQRSELAHATNVGTREQFGGELFGALIP